MHETPTLPAGSVFRHPDGVGKLTVLRTAEQTQGAITELEAICEPGLPGVGERSFPEHEVSFEVLEGRLLVGVHGEPRPLGAGHSLRLDPGTPHRIWVEGKRSARFIWRMRPAAPAGDLLDLVFGLPRGDQLMTETDHSQTGGTHV
jgi:quercetin dioxygenase-like cupin family protein